MSPLFPFVRARRAAVYVFIVVAIVAVTSGGRAQSPAAAPPAQQQPPPFRAGTNFVHVDVYPTANGTTVPDLAAADFEVLEDGVPQKIETFEHVNIQGLTPEEAKAEPTSTREAASMAETTKGRIFVIFLDKYFVTLYGSHDIRRPLVNFLNRLLGPDDMFAVMTPDMSAVDLSFARKTGTVEDNLRRFWFWGQKDDNILPDDPTERAVQECYGDSRMPATALNELVQRRREKKVIDALTDLTIYLRGVREGRKAVITITGGWLLFRENKDLNTDRRRGCRSRSAACRPQVEPAPGSYSPGVRRRAQCTRRTPRCRTPLAPRTTAARGAIASSRLSASMTSSSSGRPLTVSSMRSLTMG